MKGNQSSIKETVMNPQTKILMFTDQVGSTPGTTKRTHGEIFEVKSEQNRLTASAATHSRGKIIKDTGDGNILEFESFQDAVQCGHLLQNYVRERNGGLNDDKLKFELHVGIDFGDVIQWEDDDVSGEAANSAARFCSACPPGEVYFTESIAEKLKSDEVKSENIGKKSLKGIGNVTLYRLVECLIPIDPPSNPFVWSIGITVAEEFFGREKELADLKAYLAGNQSQNCQIIGPRRIGKSSLLLHITRLAPKWLDTFVPVYVDMQDARCETLKSFLALVGKQFGWPSVGENMADATEHFESMVKNGKRPILCMDEFENLMKNHDNFGENFLVNLRACGKMVALITSSKKPLCEIIPSDHPTSAFFNQFRRNELGGFAQEEAEDFVNYYRPGVERFSDEEKAAILIFAENHPLALQVACFRVLNAKRNGDTLHDALKKAREDMKGHLPGEW